MFIIPREGVAVNKSAACDFYNGTIFPARFPLFGIEVSPLAKRSENDSLNLRTYVSGAPDLRLFNRSKNNPCLKERWLSDCGILVTYFQKYSTRYIEVQIRSLPKFALGRSSAVFKLHSSLKDRMAQFERLNEIINDRFPIYGTTKWFKASACRISRSDQFTDLRFANQKELDAFFDIARSLRFDRLQGNECVPIEYPRTETTERGLTWFNGVDLPSSTELLKLYAKRTLDRNRKFGDEENKLKLRLEVTRQKKGDSDPLADAFKNELCLPPEDLTLENLMRQSIINRLFLSVAAPFFTAGYTQNFAQNP